MKDTYENDLNPNQVKMFVLLFSLAAIVLFVIEELFSFPRAWLAGLAVFVTIPFIVFIVLYSSGTKKKLTYETLIKNMFGAVILIGIAWFVDATYDFNTVMGQHSCGVGVCW